MNFSELNTVDQGSVGLGMAIAHFVSKGYVVSLPLNDNQPYDLIVDYDNALKKVSVKTTRFKVKGQSPYTVELKSNRPNRTGNKVKKFDGKVVDLLFVLTESGDKYLVPAAAVHNTNSLCLGKKAEQWKIRE